MLLLFVYQVNQNTMKILKLLSSHFLISSIGKKASLLLILNFLISLNIFSQRPLITTWKTDNPGTSDSTSITIPTTGTGYNYDVDWNNDGTYDEAGITGSVTHDFGTPGAYTIRIKGDFPRIFFNNRGDKTKLISVEQWGDISWKSMESAFMGCLNFNINAVDVPDLTHVQSMSYMFCGCSLFNGNIGTWEVSNITNMSYMFSDASVFNQDIGNWDVSNVTDMSWMFSSPSFTNYIFNQNIGKWDVSNVTDMTGMFSGALHFNQSIGNWDISNVTKMDKLFQDAQSFNQDLGNWNVSNVTTMSYMFEFAGTFNKNIENWNILNVKDISYMFSFATHFNQNLSKWNVSQVTNMEGVFHYARSFDQNIQDWNISKVTNMKDMFNFAVSFNKPLATWDVSQVVSMEGMFYHAETFNQNIENWDVRNVTNMSLMFGNCDLFNQPIDKWDVGNVTDMSGMFISADFFNQPIGNWDVGNVINMAVMFAECGSFNSYIGNWDVGNVIDMSVMFAECTNFNQDIGNWNVSNVTSMWFMFLGCTKFNSDISKWDVSKVTNMEYMFASCKTFNQDIGNWDVGNVINMAIMFSGCESFNQDIGKWNVENVTDMAIMFASCYSFNQDLGNWNVSNVKDMEYMFNSSFKFNQNLGKWSLNKDVNMNYMLSNCGLSCENYDKTLIGWNSNPLTPENLSLDANYLKYWMADGARDSLINIKGWEIWGDEYDACNYPAAERPFITTWKTDLPGISNNSSIEIQTSGQGYNYDIDWNNDGTYDEFGITQNAKHDFGIPGTYTIRIRGKFPQIYSFIYSDNKKLISIDSWGTIGWATMQNAFSGCENMVYIAKDIPDLHKVESLGRMFSDCSKLNGDISNWDVSNVWTMYGMFENASSFNQNLGNWDVSNVNDMRYMLDSCGLSVENYDSTLIAWSSQNVKPNIKLGVKNLKYCNSETQRKYLIDNYNWIFNGDTKDCSSVGLEDYSEYKIDIYPNPTTGNITIEGIQNAEIKIYDCLGRKVLETCFTGQEIDISDQPVGIYFVMIQSDDKLVTKKVLKN